MKTSKVTAVTANGTYDSKFGLLYKFEYKFEDGQVLNANHKTQDGNYAVGEEIEYEVKGSNDYGSWGKVSRPQAEGFNGGFKKDPKTQDAILYQTCLKGAMEYLTANTGALNGQEFTAQNVNDLAFAIAQGAKANIDRL